jgi:hypothetical protein
LRKPLHLETTIAGPLIGTCIVSKEIATSIPIEIATLQGSADNENEANSDTNFLYGDPNIELLGRESNDDRESEALA